MIWLTGEERDWGKAYSSRNGWSAYQGSWGICAPSCCILTCVTLLDNLPVCLGDLAPQEGAWGFWALLAQGSVMVPATAVEALFALSWVFIWGWK